MKLILAAVIAMLAVSPIYAIDTSKTAFLEGQYYNNLISDNDFIDIDCLSVVDIQDFLTQEGSFLKDYSEGGRSAAQIIWDAAHAITPDSSDPSGTNGIVVDQSTGTVSPWVILCTLQKEQALITRTTYSQFALDRAMGYGIIDSGGGNPAYYGFANQVDWAAWQLRYNFHRAEPERTWATNYKVGQTMTFSNTNYPNMDVSFENRATASLYRYTPHVFNGNYNFWKLYNEYSQPVPEPSSLLVLGSLITPLVLLKRRKRR